MDADYAGARADQRVAETGAMDGLAETYSGVVAGWHSAVAGVNFIRHYGWFDDRPADRRGNHDHFRAERTAFYTGFDKGASL